MIKKHNLDNIAVALSHSKHQAQFCSNLTVSRDFSAGRCFQTHLLWCWKQWQIALFFSPVPELANTEEGFDMSVRYCAYLVSHSYRLVTVWGCWLSQTLLFDLSPESALSLWLDVCPDTCHLIVYQRHSATMPIAGSRLRDASDVFKGQDCR